MNGTKVVLKSDNLVRYTEQKKRADRKILKLKEERAIYLGVSESSSSYAFAMQKEEELTKKIIKKIHDVEQLDGIIDMYKSHGIVYARKVEAGI